MAKYRNKPVFIDAVRYQRGMEDGFDCYSISGMFIGTFGKDGPLPRVQQLPFINTPQGKLYLSEGCYIITEANGKRSTMPASIFELLYEKVDE
ncbi:hypothetical protein [Aneurinibacillus migulanus]|uniref:Uncharacterized protein n=1 Tax=Aneurinibacillus migulanus TaxID=47500 RepID=A0A0D1YAR2_ANEMI|nr:hypothetical protein [Aneurinibacillus migulanus]KIV56212.1 hypothetical protein TS65_13415 [Aneurinibacillus migulanus]KON84277.1 hypothetical protein AF333_30560 [Aneurinibacillus migulanus]MED0893827.1 hypothetical protein [Aneurinibacillus migulanus]MED1614506.1 hypothetical protein [Aneurinibacillus migulanus]SDI83983.1 hypothetical protein SAMN04487909_108127 [Aneurinibacillus migulanus]